MSFTLAELQQSFARVCLALDPDPGDLAALNGDPQRWLLYRQMVRSRFIETTRIGLAGTAALLGERFDRDLAAYLDAPSPRTRYLRNVVMELVEHALPAWSRDAGLPAHLNDLARYEMTKWTVGSLPWPAAEVREFDFERRAAINPTVRTLRIEHRVDRDAKAPPRLAEPEHLLVFRKPEGTLVHTWGLNEIGGRLFAAWCADQTCADAVRRVLAELDRGADAAFIDGMAGVLADLVDQGVILGSL